MVYTVKLEGTVLYWGTSAEHAAKVAAHYEGSKSFTEGVEIWWMPLETPVRKPIKAVTAVTLLREAQFTPEQQAAIDKMRGKEFRVWLFGSEEIAQRFEAMSDDERKEFIRLAKERKDNAKG